jgi:prevent-host-death family protein
MTTLSVTEAKTHFLELIRDSQTKLKRFTFVRQGKPAAVLMNADEFEGWLETVNIMSDKKTLKNIRNAREEIQTGKTKSFLSVVGRKQKK